MRIGIIGTGNVGSALGTQWARACHDIIFGVRDPSGEKAGQAVQKAGVRASAAEVGEAISAGEAIVFATPFQVAREILEGAGDLDGRIVVDCMNPLSAGLELSVGHSTSGAEQVQSWAQNARVVKAFNTTGAENMADPRYGSEKVTMFICGDDADATSTVAGLAGDAGFDPCITGPLYHARYLEPMAMLWIDMAIKQGQGRNFAFKILRR